MTEVGIRSVTVVTNGMSNGYCNKQVVCECCPYGYHIDLDFVKFCEKMAMESGIPSASKRQRRERRRQTQSMEVLLGLISPTFWNIQNSLPQITQEVTLLSSDAPPFPPPRFSSLSGDNDPLKKAVQDFEATLERTSKLERKKSDIQRQDAPSPIGTVKADDTTRKVPDATHLQTIREQMAASLERMRDLEEQVNIIPVLKKKISSLDAEKCKLLNRIRTLETDSKLKTSVRPTRDMSVSCFVTTREVGITPVCIKSRSVSVEMRPETVDKSCFTYDIEKYAKPGGISLKDLDNVRKVSKAMQTSQPLEFLKVIEKRDSSIQVDCIKKDISVMAKPKTTDFSTEFRPQIKDCGVSEDKVTDILCDKCQVIQRRSIGVGTDFLKSETLPVPGVGLSNRSKSFDYSAIPKKKLTRNIGSNTMIPVKKLTANKYTSTMVLTTPSKHVGINTDSAIFVSVGVGDNVAILDDVKPKDGAQSKIPIPKSARERRSTYTITDITRLNTSSPIAENTQQEAAVAPEVTVVRREKPARPVQKDTDEIQKRLSRDLTLQDVASGVDRASGLFDDFPFDYDEHYDSQESNRNSQMFPDSALFQPIQEKSREKLVPSKEMKAALKVVNDALLKNPLGLPKHARNASNIIQQEWFKVSSTESANPLDVEDYLDHFEASSSTLLGYIVNMVDKNGNTAMHYAVSHGNFDIVSILLDSKVCNVNKHNAAGYTCIMLVSLAQVRSDTHRQVIRRLFQLGDVNSRATQHGQTALMLAVSHGRLDMVQLLLEAGADPNIQDSDGSTALMCAAEHGHLAIVKLILAHPDTDVSIVDCDGSSALAIAMEAGNKDIGVLLYAKEHFSTSSRGSSPYQSQKRRSRPTSSPVSNSPRPSKRSEHS